MNNDIIDIVVVGTGSNGNGYIVRWNGVKILLDAGMSGDSVRKMNGNRLSDISAVFVTHEHKDHAKYVDDYLKFGIPVYIPQNSDIQATPKLAHSLHFITESSEWKRLPNTLIKYRATLQAHDAICFSYEFCLDDTVLHYVTDTREIHIAELQKQGIHFWICECDYSEELMSYNDNTMSAEIAARNVRTRETHLSDKYVEKFFASTPHDAVLFVHWSKLNFNKEKFLDTMRNITWCGVAEAGKNYKFNAYPREEIKSDAY